MRCLSVGRSFSLSLNCRKKHPKPGTDQAKGEHDLRLKYMKFFKFKHYFQLIYSIEILKMYDIV